MSLFEYKGRNAEGQAVKGVLEVSSVEAAANQLSNRGITPTQIEQAKPSTDVDAALSKLLGNNKVRPEDLIILTRQLYTITKAGLPLIRGVRGLSSSMRNPRLREALTAIGDDLEAGLQVSVAMLKHRDIFDNLYINMVKVGENSGQLEAVFDQLSVYLERDLETKKLIKSALRYPIFVLMALAVALAVVNIWVIPEFANMFSKFGSELPLATRILIATSNFFVAYWPHILVVLAASFTAFKHYVKTDEGAVWWGSTALKFPIFGDIIHRALMARYARAFSLMLRSGVPLTQSLELSAGAVGNEFVGGKIRNIKEGIERGDSLLRTHNQSELFTPLVLQMILVGEESGKVDELLAEVAGFYEREVDYDIKTLSARIEPVLIVTMAGFVMVLALGIFLPMWEMFNIQQ